MCNFFSSPTSKTPTQHVNIPFIYGINSWRTIAHSYIFNSCFRSLRIYRLLCFIIVFWIYISLSQYRFSDINLSLIFWRLYFNFLLQFLPKIVEKVLSVFVLLVYIFIACTFSRILFKHWIVFFNMLKICQYYLTIDKFDIVFKYFSLLDVPVP